MNEIEFRKRAQQILDDIVTINNQMNLENDEGKKQRLYKRLLELKEESDRIFRELIGEL